ncbi:MAG: Gfo/Idh/MocA family protein [Burkholderiales bacterium]
MIDAAIVGLGRWGRGLVDSVQAKSDKLRFVIGVEPAMDGAREFAAKHHFRLVSALDEALADLSHAAVVLATPHSLHRPQVLAAARAGKHVFCEKPLALTRADAEAMLQACARASVVLGVGHNRRWWPAMRELKALVESGRLGTLLHLEGHNSNENSNAVRGGWRTLDAESPGGGMTGAGLHALDAMVGIAGPVKRVRAQFISRKPPPAPHDTVSALLEFESGVSGLLATVRATPFYWRVHAFGTLGNAEVLDETGLVLRMSGRPLERRTLAAADSLLAELEAFADAAEGRAPFPVTPAQMLDTVAAFESVLEALRA